MNPLLRCGEYTVTNTPSLVNPDQIVMTVVMKSCEGYHVVTWYSEVENQGCLSYSLHMIIPAPTTTDKNYQLEPGLLRAFRFLMLLPMTVILPIPVILWIGSIFGIDRFLSMPTSAERQAVFPLSIIVTCIYLYLPWFYQRLGRWFLPIALALCTVGPMWTLLNDLRLALDERVLDAIAVIWAAPLLLLIPITIIAWQYHFRHLVFYCLLLAGIEVGYNLLVGLPETLRWWNLLQFTVSRTAIFLSIGYLISRMVEAQRQQRAELSHVNQQLRQYASTLEQLTVSRERNRMAHELHDTIAHTMSGMILQLEGVQMAWENDSQRARQSLDVSIGTARQGLNETRRALKALRASPLVEKGVVEAVRHLATDIANRNKYTLNLRLPSQPLKLAPEIEQTLYRITQEALTNIERHAEATAITVEICAEANEVRLKVSDNGRGFSLEEAEKSDRLGLRGMYERAALVNGQLTVESVAGNGANLEFRVKG